MPDQESYGRFTQGAWNFIKSIKLTGEEADNLRIMIEAITLNEIKAMVYSVVRGCVTIDTYFKRAVDL